MKLPTPTPTPFTPLPSDPQGTSPIPTSGPNAKIDISPYLQARQDAYVTIGKTCGAYNYGSTGQPYVCPNSLSCVGAPAFSYFGCCAAGQNCLQPWTACVDYTNTSVRSSCSAKGPNGCTPGFTTICSSDVPYCLTNHLQVQSTPGAPIQSYKGIVCQSRDPGNADSTIWSPLALRTSTSIASSTISSASTSTAVSSSTPSSETVLPSISASPSADTAPSSSNAGAIAGGVVGGVAGLALIAGAIAFYVLRMKKSRQLADASVPMLQTNYVEQPR